MTRTRTGQATVVLDTDQNPRRGVVRAIGQTYHRLDEIAIRKRALLFTLELHPKCLTRADEAPQILKRHDSPPYGGDSSRTRIGLVIASTSSQ